VNVDLGIWKKLTKLIIFLLVSAALLGIALWYLPLIQQNERMRKEILALDNEIKKEDENHKRLKADIEALRDPRTVERLAREKLNFARPNETVIRFEEPLTNAVAPGSPR